MEENGSVYIFVLFLTTTVQCSRIENRETRGYGSRRKFADMNRERDFFSGNSSAINLCIDYVMLPEKLYVRSLHSILWLKLIRSASPSSV